jgi:hypothetical protein
LFVSWFTILLQNDVGIAFLIGFARVMQNPPNSKIYVMEPKGFMGYLERGIACEFNSYGHEQYPFDNLFQNNYAHGVYKILS